jgi:transcriptional repressor NrdR
MKCPYCSFTQDRVVDSREIEESAAVRRRRECERCARRFTTYERLDEIPCMVVKKDGRREKFDRQKMLTGLQHACEKRPVAMRQLEDLVGEAEVYLNEAAERERSTSELGELIMNGLKKIDTIAYIRFASVYREFKDAAEFRDELEALVQSRTQAVTEAATQAVHEAVSEAVSKAIGRPKSNPAMKEPAPTL